MKKAAGYFLSTCAEKLRAVSKMPINTVYIEQENTVIKNMLNSKIDFEEAYKRAKINLKHVEKTSDLELILGCASTFAKVTYYIKNEQERKQAIHILDRLLKILIVYREVMKNP